MEQKPKSGGRKKKIIKIIMILAIAAVVCAVLLKHVTFVGGFPMLKKKEVKVEKKAVAEIPLPVKAYKVSLVDFTDTLPSLGTIKGYHEIDMKFSESGYLEYVNFKDGEKVVEGDIIASLDQRESLLKLEYAKNELEKNQKLFDLGSIIELKLNQSKLEYQSARMAYEKTNLIAPYDGYIGSLEVEKGDFVTPNDKIGSFVNLTDAYAEFGIIEKDIAKIKVGQTVSMTVDSYPQDVFNGEIESVSPVVEGKSRTFKIKARVTNESEKLKAGMFGRVGILIYEKQNALIIPSASFKKKEEEYFVYVIHPDEPKKDDAAAEGAEGTEGGDKAGTGDKKDAAKSKAKEKKQEAAEPVKAAAPAAAGEGKAPGGEAAGAPGAPGAAEGAPAAKQETTFGTIEIRPVQISYTTPDAVELKAGLEEGELIVADIQQEFEEKAKVEVTEVQENIF